MKSEGGGAFYWVWLNSLLCVEVSFEAYETDW